MRKGWAVVALCVPAVALNLVSKLETDVRAEAPVATVVVLRPAKSDPVTTEAMARVQGELKAAGFEVAVLPLHDDDARHDLESAGAQLRPIAAFALFVSSSEDGPPMAEIWVSDRIRQKTIIQHAVLDEQDRGRGSKVLAVRAVELLKASLADFWTPAARAAAASASAPSAPVAPVRESESKAPAPFTSGPGVGVGIGVAENFGAVGVTWAPYASLSYGFAGAFTLRARFDGLGPGVTLSSAAGSARIEQQLGMVEAVKAWWPQSLIVPFVFAVAGVQHIYVAGTATVPYRAHKSDDWSFLTAVGGGLSVPLLAWMSLVVQARAMTAWPTTAVQIADVEVGRIGGPTLMVDGGLLGVLQ
jgi:hypothetical protein